MKMQKLVLLIALPMMAQAGETIQLGVTNVWFKNIPEAPPELQKQMNENKIQLKQKGYIEKNLRWPRQMLSMRNNPKFSISKDKENTELRKNVSEINLAFSYKPKTSNPIGFAPVMQWTDKGWTGIKEFFDAEKNGVCSLQTVNMDLSHMAVRLLKENITYDVNKKVTDVLIEGSANTGYLYRVTWYDKTYEKTLECATMIYDKEITNKVIELAKNLDKK